MLSFIKPKKITKILKTADGQEVSQDFLSMRPRHVPIVGEVLMPFIQGVALTSMSSDKDHASRAVDTYNAPAEQIAAEGTFSNFVRETDAITPELAKMREDQIRTGIQQIVMGGLGNENLTKIAEVVLGCMPQFRAFKIRELRKEAEDFMDDPSLDLDMFVQLIEGAWEANKEKFGPFIKTLTRGQKIEDLISRVKQTQQSSKPSDEQESKQDLNLSQGNEAPSTSTTQASMPSTTTSTPPPSPSPQPSTSPLTPS